MKFDQNILLPSNANCNHEKKRKTAFLIVQSNNDGLKGGSHKTKSNKKKDVKLK